MYVDVHVGIEKEREREREREKERERTHTKQSAQYTEIYDDLPFSSGTAGSKTHTKNIKVAQIALHCL